MKQPPKDDIADDIIDTTLYFPVAVGSNAFTHWLLTP
jgi:hypothetical protein